MPMEEVEGNVPSPPPMELAQPPKADCRHGQLTVAVCGHMSAHVAGVAANPRIQWDVIEDQERHAAPRSTPKAIGTPSLLRGGPNNY